MESKKLYTPEPTSAPGDFYVEYNCCTSCGVPQVVAPDLVGWVEQPLNHCYWKKQPETPDELERVFKIFDGQELGCHRYAGQDPAIQERVGYDQCDHGPQREAQILRQNNFLISDSWGKRTAPEPEPPKSSGLWSRIFRRNRS